MPGFIVQANNNDKFGIINAGGSGHSSFLAFSFAACSAPVQQRLAQGDIPPNPGFAVQFDTSFQNGHFIAVNVR
jgi:hypothetical protein